MYASLFMPDKDLHDDTNNARVYISDTIVFKRTSGGICNGWAPTINREALETRATSRSTRSETGPLDQKDVEVIEIPDGLSVPLGPSTSAKRRVESGSTGEGQHSVKRNKSEIAVPKPVYYDIPCMECLIEKYRPICEDLHIMAQKACRGKDVDNDEFQTTFKQIQMPMCLWSLIDKLRIAEMTLDLHKAELLMADATFKQVNELTKKFENIERGIRIREKNIDRLEKTVAHETELRKTMENQLHDLVNSLTKEEVENAEANEAEETQIGEEEQGNHEEAGDTLLGDEDEVNDVDAEGEDVNDGEYQESK
ncbi:hypothetical protein FSARC_7460 [Fusarium sarcochroum]|uniref:Uncharacterized protein n=1 Tax=Fusarium sarcochroum TaxID=1208366 RepID=A0A8H4TVC5_9HYPO|nr:hypothetical protein FSARC_7460 [Fusarium sarcochroum]